MRTLRNPFPIAFAVILLVLISSALFGQSPTFPQGDATVRVRWNASRELDLAGYRIYWGTNSMNPQFVRDIAPTNTTTTLVLPSANRWFLYLTAYNTAGLESDPSAELVVAKPSQVSGVNFVAVITTTTNIIVFP